MEIGSPHANNGRRYAFCCQVHPAAADDLPARSAILAQITAELKRWQRAPVLRWGFCRAF